VVFVILQSATARGVMYRGSRDACGAIVVIESGGSVSSLPPCNQIYNHSPDGFEWGYAGSGPAQLALALCMHALEGDQARATRVYQRFKEQHIATLDQEDQWAMSQEQVLGWVRQIEQMAEGGI
jgi:hypothetical protein